MGVKIYRGPILASGPKAQAGFIEKWLPWLLLGAGLIAYHNSFHGPFILDGQTYIESDSALHQLTLENLIVGTSRPLTRLTFGLNYALGGLSVVWFHAANLAIHLAAGLALFGLTRRTLLSPALAERFDRSTASAIAGAAALLWIVHPLQTESVTYIYERAESLMGLFYLSTIYAVARAMQDRGSSRVWSLAAVAVCLAGMAAKAIMITAPLTAIVYGRIFWTDSWRGLWRRHGWLFISLVSTALVLLVIASRPTESTGSIGTSAPLQGALEYARFQPRAILHYLKQVFWPSNLVLDYGPLRPRDGFWAMMPFCAIGGLLGLTVWSLLRKPTIGFLGVWFFFTLAPTSSFFPIADMIVEHRMYLALAAVTVGMVLAVQSLIQRFFVSEFKKRVLMLGLLAVTAGALTAVTVERNTMFREPIQLWQDLIAKRPNNPHAYTHLALEQLEQGKFKRAIANYFKAIKVGGKYGWIRARRGLAYTYVNLGSLLYSRNLDAQSAMAYFKKALKIRPHFLPAQKKLAGVLIAVGRHRDAEKLLIRAVKDHPGDDDAWTRLEQLREMRGSPR